MSNRTDEPTDPSAAVAEEAMRLVESLGAWAGANERAREHAADGSTSADALACDCASRATTSSTPAVCGICPICRIGAFVESLSPEIMERLADLIAMFAGTLQASAEQRRAAAAEQPAAPAQRTPGTASHKVPVTDENDTAGSDSQSSPDSAE